MKLLLGRSGEIGAGQVAAGIAVEVGFDEPFRGLKTFAIHRQCLRDSSWHSEEDVEHYDKTMATSPSASMRRTLPMIYYTVACSIKPQNCEHDPRETSGRSCGIASPAAPAH